MRYRTHRASLAMRPYPASVRAKWAFTLIELLVVVAIIAILAAILFPVFAKAREKARQAACASNLHQIGLAAIQYVQDYDETWPMYQYGGENPPDVHYWFGACVANCTPAGPKVWDKSQGVLQPYMKSVEVVKCPSWNGKNKFGDGNGYGYNALNVGSNGNYNANYDLDDPAARSFAASDASLVHPSETVAFGDAGFINPPWYGGHGERIESPEIDPPQDWYGDPTVDFRHVDQSAALNSATQTITENGWANLLFCDGHVRAYPQSQVTNLMFARDNTTN